ncbi:hypothetical protein ACXVSK_13355 [Pseudomonas aeruginosa]|jgi:hypothetical protein|uniref:hypothetical protein n=1 Tax=Pseudomonas aeruginosa TaxID=287 RepID=UPI00053D80BF|nr:hypothetical protein [Pseudomonas aeruginosa]AYK23072.1 hypothetical protein PA34_013560 [Pseudomonas aeruginosa]EKX2112999.1 hypothetical protein [Pseudomonas aeruginosa]EKY4187234.1 hypothetical protein [Pseudomonas aeruginosa]ELL1259026.1 hypothetical protein [Pseudomonas aeruginosa]ELT3988958.1 hypothetical protein [Pseudomonas aeruginosa]
MNSKLKQVINNAQVFLLPPYASQTEREDALCGGVELLRQSIEHLVRAGRGDIGLEVLDLIHKADKPAE